MQVRFSKDRYQRGNILAMTLILSALLGITLASYLYWVRTQNLLVQESQGWNYALAVAESGIEEGMAQININEGNGLNALSYLSSIQTNSGWVGSGTGPYSKTNASLGYYVTVSNDAPPTIYSSGTTTVPLVGRTITRTVKVTTATNSFFGVGIASLQGINMNGNGIVVDAYDSADLVHFPGGLWNSNNAFAGGDVATENGMISVQNANIHGRLLLTPWGTYSLGPNGLVGDMPQNWPAQSGLESADWVFNDWNKDFPDVSVPYTSGTPPPIGSGTNSYVLDTGNYYTNGDFTVSQNLQVNGVATLYVTGNFNANSTITIAPGASLKLFVGKTSGSTSSTTFGIVNFGPGANAYNLQVFGLPRMTKFTLSGNNAYMGTIYAPECDLTLNGSGNSPIDYQGACVIRSFTSNGHFGLHYDKNLSRVGFPSGFTCASWQEL